MWCGVEKRKEGEEWENGVVGWGRKEEGRGGVGE